MDSYGRRIIVDLPFEPALAATLDALRLEGIDVVGRLDVREYLERALHHDFRRYLLLDVIAPELAFDALRQDPGVGAILPATIAVFELADGETAVVASEPFAGLDANPGWRRDAHALAALADRACEQMARAMGRLQHIASTIAGPVASPSV